MALSIERHRNRDFPNRKTQDGSKPEHIFHIVNLVNLFIYVHNLYKQFDSNVLEKYNMNGPQLLSNDLISL